MKKLVWATLILLILVLVLFLIRMVSPRQLDDVSPEIPCEYKLLQKADILFIIPRFNNKSIDNSSWCNEIKNLNKTLALHGIYHNYKEFSEDKSEEYLNQGLKIFQDCFSQSPAEFKPPQLSISKTNKKLIKSKMKLDTYFNQITHKVYHCNDSGLFSNKIINII